MMTRYTEHNGASLLAVPDGVTLSPTALVCHRELPFSEWKKLGLKLLQSENSIQWWFGDLWRYGCHRYGERKAKVTAKGVFGGYAFGTLMNYGYVASRVETSRRREVLSWSHHYEVAKLEAGEQDYWLDRAVREKLSVAKLGSEIAAYELLADCCYWDARLDRTAADEEAARYLRRLEKVAKIASRLIWVPPWEYPGLGHFPYDWQRLAIACQEAAIFWDKADQFIRLKRRSPGERADEAVPFTM